MGYLDNSGVSHLWAKIKAAFVAKETGKGLSTNDFTTAEKDKLAGIESGANKYTLPTAGQGTLGGVKTSSTVDSTTGLTPSPIIGGIVYYKDTNTTYPVVSSEKDGLMSKEDKQTLDNLVATGGEVNQNAFSNVVVGSTTIAADTKTDSLTIAGSGAITVTGDAANDKVTISTSAQANVIESVKVNGTALSVSSKAVNITVPTTVAALTDAGNYALKSDLTNVYKYKGSVANTSALPKTDNTSGDVYNVEDSGMNYAWNGETWDSLGEIVKIDSITNDEIDTICV